MIYVFSSKTDEIVQGELPEKAGKLYDAREERITKTGETTVVNAYAHWIIEYPQKQDTQ